MKKTTKAETTQYVAFLEKRLASKNYKVNVTPEEYAKTKEKLDKARYGKVTVFIGSSVGPELDCWVNIMADPPPPQPRTLDDNWVS